jgi:hypothetical protein
VRTLTKSVLTEYRLELSTFLSLLFGFLTAVSLVGVFMGDDAPSYLQFIVELGDPFGNWLTWFVLIGPIGLVVCLWWFYDYVKKTKELAKLIDTPSKAKFVRNMDDIEYLAWVLPQRFENEVLAKKKEFKL